MIIIKPQFLIFLIALLVSCAPEENGTVVSDQEVDPIPTEVEPPVAKDTLPEEINSIRFNFSQWKERFTYKEKITCFNEDSIASFEKFAWQGDSSYISYSAPIIGELLQQIECLEKLEPWHQSIHEGTNFLYSIQEETDHIGITVIGGNNAWVTEIRYLTFTLEGKKISDVILAAQGGDGGYYTKGHGCFLNDSIYSYQFEETEFDFEREVFEVYETGDLTYQFHSNGKIDTLTNVMNTSRPE